MITLDVKTKGGVCPFPIKVSIDNLDPNNNFHTAMQQNGSFNQNFNLPKGQYAMIIGGSNAINGSTDINLTGTFVSGPNPQSHYNKTTSLYTAIFTFTV
jgi:hypothetical protein